MSKMSKVRNSMRVSGSTLIISSLLVSSAFLRFGTDTGAAIAQTTMSVMETDVVSTENDTSKQADASSGSAQLLEALLKREAEVERQEAALAQRENNLKATKAEVERRIGVLEASEARLRQMITQAEATAEDDVLRLTTVYENMKPKDAAALFETMEPEFAAGFLARMQPEAAAKLLAGLNPETAYSISAIVAGRNARASNL
ncbi:hypothetical protein [uncultured Tateyamaria sp.]|uniref:MotE family protein n=1 Tax=uncultured Tateyamaria sp. TaxID=455651 RepID=UPI0026086055|nr:hypothetical protein [uncultured Tateyamaria sp.]